MRMEFVKICGKKISQEKLVLALLATKFEVLSSISQRKACKKALKKLKIASTKRSVEKLRLIWRYNHGNIKEVYNSMKAKTAHKVRILVKSSVLFFMQLEMIVYRNLISLTSFSFVKHI